MLSTKVWLKALLFFHTPGSYIHSIFFYFSKRLSAIYWVILECSVTVVQSYWTLSTAPGTAACQASLSFSISQSLLKFMSIESVMASNHLILCCPLLLLPSIFPSIRVFSSELAFRIRWPKHWSFSFSISTSNEYSGLISFRINRLDLLAVQKVLSKVFSSTTIWKHQFLSAQPSLWSNSHIHTWLLPHTEFRF